MQIFGLRYVGNREEEWIDAAGLILTDPLHALVGCQSRLSDHAGSRSTRTVSKSVPNARTIELLKRGSVANRA